MNWTIELIGIPVSDIARAKDFYESKLNFVVDFDHGEGTERIVQLTPPGSGCSIMLAMGQTSMKPGDLDGVQIVVNDVRSARKQLAENGVEISQVMYFGWDGVQRTATPEDDLNNSGFAFFSDPDGNKWAIQQISNRS